MYALQWLAIIVKKLRYIIIYLCKLIICSKNTIRTKKN